MRTRGEGGSEHDQKYAFVCRFIENATISETFKGLVIKFRKRGDLTHNFITILSPFFFLDLNEKKKMGKKGGGGLRLLAVCTQEGGGGHSDSYSVQQGGWGDLKIWKNCVCNLWKAPFVKSV